MITDNEKVWGINKLIKIPRLLVLYQKEKIIDFGNINHLEIVKKLRNFVNISKNVMTLYTFFISMFLLTHISGCMWLFLAKFYDYGQLSSFSYSQLKFELSIQ